MPFRAVSDLCEFKRRSVTGNSVNCGKSLVFRRDDGEIVHVYAYSHSSERYVGPCCLSKMSKDSREAFEASYPDWPKAYTSIEPTEAQEREQRRRQQAFRHALGDGPVARVGGLKRMDGSGDMDVQGLGYVPSIRRIG